MNIFSFLLGRAPRPDGEPPFVIIGGKPFIAPNDDDLRGDEVDQDEIDEQLGETGETPRPRFAIKLQDAFCVLEYRDITGTVTRRRVTMSKIVDGPNAPLIRAICHERRAPRTFRADRVQAVITDDGELISLDQFLHSLLGHGLPDHQITIDTTAEATQLARLIGDGLTVLVAAARADNDWHHAEVEAIETYAEREALALRREGVTALPLDETAALRIIRTINRMRPQRDTLAEAIARIGRWPQPRQDRLRRSLEQVIAADGILHADELEFIAIMPDPD